MRLRGPQRYATTRPQLYHYIAGASSLAKQNYSHSMLDFVNKIITIESAVWCVLIFFLNNTYKIVRDISFDIAKLRKYNSIVLRDYSQVKKKTATPQIYPAAEKQTSTQYPV